MFIRGIGGPEPIKPIKDTKTQKNISNLRENPAPTSDQIEISKDAQEIFQKQQIREEATNIINSIPDIRQEAVERGKIFIESGRYKSPEAIDTVANRIVDEMTARKIVEEEEG